MKRNVLFTAWISLIFCVGLSAQSAGYYRFPVIRGGTIIFTSEGDLWKVDAAGGTAVRLTTHLGTESHPAISPDGKLVAFSAEYEGPTEVYTMPVAGGLPTRWTYEGEAAIVVGWTPGGQILYSTNHFSTLPNTQLAVIDLEKKVSTVVPLSQASDGVLAPGGKTIFFTRLPFQGSQTKRYQGGTAQNIWKFTDGEEEAIPLTPNYPGTSKCPMWWNHRVYFASDRDGTMNIWSMDESGGDMRQHTFHQGWDVQSPALDNGKIVYQLGADLYLLNIAAGSPGKVPITMASDFDQTRENWVKKPADYLTDVHISPDGSQIVLTARGKVFVAPAEKGRFVEVTRKQGVRYRNARFLPDKKSLLLLSDASGEQEFWQYPANGVEEGQQLTRDAKVLRFGGVAAPDGKRFAFTDKNTGLWIGEFASQPPVRIDVSSSGGFYHLSWSPDSKWLAYVDGADNLNSQILLYNLETRQKAKLTSDRVDSYNPCWSADGKWLYFLSDRNFQNLVGSPWGSRQPEPFYDKTTKIYAISLQKDQLFPFKPKDELQLANKPEEQKDKDKKDKANTPETVTVKIDLDGIQVRVMEVPVKPGNYSGLMVSSERLFWTETDAAIDAKSRLVAVAIKADKVEPKTIVEDIKRYELSLDGKKLLVQKDDGIYVLDSSATSSDKLSESKVDLSAWAFSVNPREEWRQMFVDAWRLERDYFYDPGLHGLDWNGLLQKHLPLVDRVATRDELNDLIAQLVGELSSLHIFVFGGDRREGEDQIRPASLGAALERDIQSGGYRIAHIYQSEPDYLDRLSPLARPDVHLAEGDVILAIDGVPALSVAHPSVLLRNKGDQQILLKVKAQATGKIFTTIVKPISSSKAITLRYDDWEYSRRLQVEKMGSGKVGYVHLRAMGGDNYSEWVRNFYPVFDRQALIIDVRNNEGGNIDSWILEKLLRKAWFYWQSRVAKPTWNMQYAFRGHMVVLCNEGTASDGEAFTEGFRRLGLGKVIGTRTWGGEIWLSFDNPLVDKGMASAAQFGVYGPEGKWLIEGRGVEPDIMVDNLPHAAFLGKDAQLEAAVDHLLGLMRDDPRLVPPPPPFPDKSFDYTKSADDKTKK